MFPECKISECFADTTRDYSKIIMPPNRFDLFSHSNIIVPSNKVDLVSHNEYNKVEPTKSDFDYDLRFANLLSEFNKIHFYPYAFPDNKFEKIFIEDKTMQDKGVDVILINKRTGERIYLDEKSAGHYINSPIKTFIFETISGRKVWSVGWFIREGMLTDYYLLQWVQADFNEFAPVGLYENKGYYKRIELEHIENVVSCFIKKEDIWNFYFQLGYSLEKIYDLSLKLKNSGKSKMVIGEFDLRYSGSTLYEKPVNLRLFMDTLQNICARKNHPCCFLTSKNDFRVVNSLEQAYLGLFSRGV